MTAESADVVVSRGTGYAAWISGSASAGTNRVVHLCVLPRGARKCKGGVQTIDSLGSSSASGLTALNVNGVVTLVWFHDTDASVGTTHGGKIAVATVNGSDHLSAAADVASAPSFGSLLDAEVGPGGIWTVAYGQSLPKELEVRAGLSNPPTIVKTPYGVGFADLAFAGSTPIIAIAKYGTITDPAAYSYRKNGKWLAFKNVAKTWTVGAHIGLTRTTHGVRLTTEINNTSYRPVVSKWNGHGFTARSLTGDTNSCAPSSHDTGADASGRMVDVANECGKITVSNLTNTTRAAITRFKAGGTVAGPDPQIASTPRGRAWVLWAVLDGTGDKLTVTSVLLPDRHKTKHGSSKHGSVSVKGPATCLPPDAISVSVKGHPDHGWKVASRKLTLSGKKVSSPLNGAALTPGKKYALKGTATFAGGSHHTTASATVTFRACPNP
jgi:hypothetical protein